MRAHQIRNVFFSSRLRKVTVVFLLFSAYRSSNPYHTQEGSLSYAAYAPALRELSLRSVWQTVHHPCASEAFAPDWKWWLPACVIHEIKWRSYARVWQTPLVRAMRS